MIRKILAMFAAVLFVAGVTGCNTVKGAGEDVENVGEEIQGAFD